jgi:Mg-chelatase subunit ChlD
MNGGTNIATAVAKAGKLLKAAPSATSRSLVLLTDGRVDGYQVRLRCKGPRPSVPPPGIFSPGAVTWGC